MAGTLFGLGLSQPLDVNSDVMPGCLLYIFQAASSTPVQVFRDSGLSLLLPWPLEADAKGRLPQFWLADGTYRARLTDAVGALQFDEDNVLALGPSSGGGGGGPAVNPDAISSTGDIKFRADVSQISGWVRLNGKTLGSATSGATEYANLDAQSLFEYLWNNFANTICAVVGGRGASAVADWGANKQITLPDMRSRCLFGVANMGNSDSGGLDNVPFTAGDKLTGGSRGGESQHQLSGTEIPAHQHDLFIDDQGHRHLLFNHNAVNAVASATNQAGLGAVYPTSQDYLIGGRAEEPDFLRSELKTTGVRGKSTSGGAVDDKTGSVGGGGAHNNTPQFLLGGYFMRL